MKKIISCSFLLVCLLSCGSKVDISQKANFDLLDSWSISDHTLVETANGQEIIEVFQLNDDGMKLNVDKQELNDLFSSSYNENDVTDQKKLVIKDISPVTSDTTAPYVVDHIATLNITSFVLTDSDQSLHMDSQSLQDIEVKKSVHSKKLTISPFSIGEYDTNYKYGVSYIPIYEYHNIQSNGNSYELYIPDCDEHGISNGYYVVIKTKL